MKNVVLLMVVIVVDSGNSFPVPLCGDPTRPMWLMGDESNNQCLSSVSLINELMLLLSLLLCYCNKYEFTNWFTSRISIECFGFLEELKRI